ncbi:60kDa lysophospholipase [Sporothrix brasiliensis 5110]|uniref:asparaginase n=1 Tax=Sporothrix brasiliensis 5110 TaxID=1398154 RepID=A0A0C2F5A1_9PEZI|nr:60kDa lysophospholipase [Sporothrix brasiliensis 5110]KIH94089.1 60kDa lysophospholipase [Sporothrix brasiliensis 5110]
MSAASPASAPGRSVPGHPLTIPVTTPSATSSIAADAEAATPPSPFPESRVLIIMTGGTICMRPSPDGLVPMDGFLEHAMAPRPSFNDPAPPTTLTAYKDGQRLELPSLRTPVSAYSRHIRYSILEFTPLLDSSSISSAGWAEIAQAVRDNYHLFDGFVVLHGTDSLAYTASALSFMMSDLGKPVILTGSQASIFALQSDAVDNLLGSLIIAGTFVVPEVCLFFHHTLFRGNRTTKVSASSFEAFASPNAAPLARVTSLGVDVAWSLVRRPTRIAEFRIKTYLDTAHVACFRIFPGIVPEMLDSVLRVANLRGLILETFGMGNAPGGVDGSLTRVIRDAVARGIIVVNVSQCTNGFVSPLYAPATALGRAGVVFGHDLTTEAALTKLSYLLALDGLSYADIQERMARSLCGEMTELTSPVFSHPAGALGDSPSVGPAHLAGLTSLASLAHPIEPAVTPTPSAAGAPRALAADGALRPLTPIESAFTALGYAIRNGDLAAVRAVLSGGATTHSLAMLSTADYAGNTAVHLAAVGPNTDVLRELLMHGASVHVRNRGNNTPLFLAEKRGHAGNVKLLRDAGAHLWGPEAEGEGTAGAESNGAEAVKEDEVEA